MKKLKQTTLIATASLLIIPVLSQATSEKSAIMHKMPTPKADIYIVPTPEDLPIKLKYPAQIKSFRNVNVVARVLGVLEHKYFTEGQTVKKGDLLYKIEDDIYKANVDEAKASVKMSEAVLDNAKRQWQRVKKLYKNKAISQEKRDEAFSAYNQALASLSLSKAQLKRSQIDLNYTEVRAPISGTIGIKKVDIGDLVSPNPPTKLVNITQNDKVFVEFSMPFSDYLKIKNNLWSLPKSGKLSVSIEIDDRPSKLVGYVDFMDVNVDRNSATVKMRALVKNPNGYLMPGSFIRVALNGIVQKNVITIPQKALLQNPLGTIVFIDKNGKVGIKPVMIGEETGDKYIVTGGPLKSGDRVLVNNFFRLKPGGAVVADKIINQKGK